MSLLDPETKAELACARHLNGIAAAAGITVHAGVDPSNLPLPHVVCNAVNCEQHIPFSGQYLVDVEIHLESHSDDTSAATQRNRLALIRDEFANDWVGASLNNQGVTGFQVAGAVSTWGVLLGRATTTTVEHKLVSILPISIHCGVNAA